MQIDDHPLVGPAGPVARSSSGGLLWNEAQGAGPVAIGFAPLALLRGGGLLARDPDRGLVVLNSKGEATHTFAWAAEQTTTPVVADGWIVVRVGDVLQAHRIPSLALDSDATWPIRGGSNFGNYRAAREAQP